MGKFYKILEPINIARGHAEALLIKAEARARAIERVAAALIQKGGDSAASLTVAEQYVTAFEKLAKDTNTVVLPANLSEPSSMVAQALALYQNIGKKPEKP
ncbi:hypothetical protein OESDEN_13522 [Oesophagostomum dentatum]|uniref:STML2-like C-terminal extension domain-containing protein n=1 Tax=Oesophagostomum dentatum TaxID=61180 RepID=A0A0B1SU69_OESDE|nr:hypothetical protein OESDEN_13522 [Oesophagostomum dentatum]